MPVLPFLADADRVQQAAALEQTVLLDAHFGSLAWQAQDGACVHAVLALLEKHPPAAWQRAVALELLLAHSWGLPVQAALKNAFLDVPPLPDAPVLARFLEAEVATAAFPLAHGPLEKEPPWALLMLARGMAADTADHRERFETGQHSPLEREPVHGWLRLNRSGLQEMRIQDSSWHLAAWSALQALTQPDLREPLARHWLLTGRIGANGGQVDMIEPGNKLRIRTSRQFLFPAGNRPDLAGRALQSGAQRVQFAASGQAVLAHLSGRGSTDRGNDTWPSPCPVLHSFTSAAWQPVLASVLLAQPARLVLWHTDAAVSKEPAKNLQAFFKPLDGRLQVETKEIASDDLPKIQQQLSQVLEKDLQTHKEVLFNITQGTRFMSYAVLALSQIHPGMRLVYRDVDAPPFEFKQLTFESLQGETAVLHPSPPTLPLAQEDPLWGKLFAFKPPPQLQPLAEHIGEAMAKIFANYRNPSVSRPLEQA